MFRSLVASLCLAAPGFFAPLHGLEPFRPEPVTWSAPQGDPIVFGDTWVAYGEGHAAVKIADRATGQILRTLEKPANDTPVAGVPNQWRTVSQWGKRILHSGSRLAVVANAQIRDVPPGGSGYGRNVIAVFLWDLPSATPAGILDIDLSTWNPFAALSPTRLVVLDQQQRRFLQWDPVTLAPLPAITVPAEFPAPVGEDGSNPPPIAMGENTVIFRKTGYGEPLDLVAVNLASGGTTRLPLPANRVLTGRIAMGTGNDALLVASFGSGGSNTPGKLDLLHYDLGTGALVEASSLEHSTLSANDVRVLVQPDGGWRVVASSDGFYGFELVSGHAQRSPYDARVVIPSSLGLSSASAIGADDGRIWFKPRSQDLPGVRAMMLAAGPTASTVVHATALPCSESDGVLRILFTASAAPAQDTTFQVRTAGGSATSPADFTAVDRSVTLPAGTTELMITLPVAQDTVLEPTEHLTLAIVDPGDHAVFLQDEVVAMIRGTSHDLLAPVAPRLPTGEGMPMRVYLAAETMIQFTAGTSWDVPATGDRLARRPFKAASGAAVPVGAVRSS